MGVATTERRLPMIRDRIVDIGGDPLCREMAGKAVAIW